MKILISDRLDPAFHLALEEVLFFEVEFDTLLFFYRNTPSVILGKHQNPWMEANLATAEAEGIPVLRRISGGGCVVHDEDNINYSLIQKNVPSKSVDFPTLYQPVLEGLRQLGIDVQTSERNDFRVEGKKISGSAQYMRRDTTLFHGTLLVDSDLDRIHRLLDRETEIIYETHAAHSVPSPVLNLSQVVEVESTEEFLRQWVEAVGRICPVEPLMLGQEWIEKAEKLAKEKYRSWEWNRGMTPAFAAKWDSVEIKAKNGRFLAVPDWVDQSWVGKEVPEDLLRWFREQNIS